MNEHFTQPAGAALERAHEEARELHHSFVGTEHILLGVLSVSEGSAAQVLASFGVGYAGVRGAVVRMMGVGVDAPEADLSFTDRAQETIDRARREASIRDEPRVGTEHLLLALVHDPGGAAARILLQLDADPVAIRSALSS